MGAANTKPEETAPSMTELSRQQEEKYSNGAHAQEEQESLAQQRYFTTAKDGARSPRVPEHNDTCAHVSLSAIEAWDKVALADPVSRMASLTLHDASIERNCRRRKAEVDDIYVFSDVLPQAMQRTDQKQSGRCWLYAALNMMRVPCLKKLNVEDFEFSEAYLAFYDKVEKSNTFLETMLKLADRSLEEDRDVKDQFDTPFQDGGLWNFAANLIAKYGVVPKSTYPESYTSGNTSHINDLIKDKLREYALELRAMKQDMYTALARIGGASEESQREAMKVIRQRKDEMMSNIYRMTVIAYGKPPKPNQTFEFQFRNKKDEFKTIRCTPKEFLADIIQFNPEDYSELTSDPNHDEDKLIVIPYTINIWGAKSAYWANTSTSVMKQAVIKSIKAGMPVFIAIDVEKFVYKGIMDPHLFDYELPFGVEFGMTKGEQRKTRSSKATHAVAITGVHLSSNGEPIRYKVENSWGEKEGDKGFFVMTDAWFDLYVYSATIRNDLAPSHLVKLYQDGPDDDSIYLPSSAASKGLLSAAPAAEAAEGAAPSSGIQDDGDNADDEEDQEEEEYEIEAIVNHDVGVFKKGEIAFLVKWKGYGREHDSWVREEDAVNCKEMVDEYLAKNSGKMQTTKLNVGRRKRTDDDIASRKVNTRRSPLSQRPPRGTPSAAAKEDMLRKRQRTVTRALVHRQGITHDDMSEDVEAMDEEDAKRLEGEDREMHLRVIAAKRYTRLADWHDVVRRIETVERDHTGRLIAYVIFENGGRYAYDVAVVNHRCPQKMLQFYESRLRFKPNASDLAPLPVASLATSSKNTEPGSQEGEATEDVNTKDGDREKPIEAEDTELSVPEDGYHAEQGSSRASAPESREGSERLNRDAMELDDAENQADKEEVEAQTKDAADVVAESSTAGEAKIAIVEDEGDGDAADETQTDMDKVTGGTEGDELDGSEGREEAREDEEQKEGEEEAHDEQTVSDEVQI